MKTYLITAAYKIQRIWVGGTTTSHFENFYVKAENIPLAISAGKEAFQKFSTKEALNSSNRDMFWNFEAITFIIEVP